MNATARDKFIGWLIGYLDGAPPDKVWPLDRALISSRLTDALAEREPKPIGPKVVDWIPQPREKDGPLTAPRHGLHDKSTHRAFGEMVDKRFANVDENHSANCRRLEALEEHARLAYQELRGYRGSVAPCDGMPGNSGLNQQSAALQGQRLDAPCAPRKLSDE